MNKKDYIDAVNEIKVTNKQKMEVLEKMNERKNRIWFKLSLCTACVVAIVVGIFIPINVNKKQEQNYMQKQIQKEAQRLPNVKNYEELYAILQDKEYKSVASGFGGFEDIAIPDNAMSTNEISSEATNKAEADYSTTNVQVEGADEADIIKTDGKYVYYVRDDNVVIINAQDSKNLKVSSKISFDNDEFYPQEVYVEGNKLIIIGQEYNYYSDYELFDTNMVYGSNAKTTAKVYDTTNKEDVKLLREVKIDGSYLSSRMIGKDIYLVSDKYLYSVCKRYKINELHEEELLPQYQDTIISPEKQCVSYDDIYYIPESKTSSYLNIASFNVNENEKANISSYIGAGSEIYCSTENLYVTNTKYKYKEGLISDIIGDYSYTVDTKIYKFNLSEGKANYVCEGSVPGTVLNQFSMDENNGYFRLATTNSTSWDNNDSTNNMYVLDGNLNIVGKLEGLAEGERIYSVRFMGNRAYMVTFVQTDPLFVIDLSNPINPTVLGELKIPGFSNYLHPYDENHIIGFGQDAITKNYGYGDVTITNGMKMALFDVTDVNNPKEMYSVKIGDRGTYSELLYNHKALLFSKEKNLLAFPISISTENNNYYYTFQGAVVYNIDLENGFTLKGQISHKDNQNSYFYYDYEKVVERIIYIDDNLMTFSNSLVKVINMNTMEEISKLEIK